MFSGSIITISSLWIFRPQSYRTLKAPFFLIPIVIITIILLSVAFNAIDSNINSAESMIVRISLLSSICFLVIMLFERARSN